MSEPMESNVFAPLEKNMSGPMMKNVPTLLSMTSTWLDKAKATKFHKFVSLSLQLFVFDRNLISNNATSKTSIFYIYSERTIKSKAEMEVPIDKNQGPVFF